MRRLALVLLALAALPGPAWSATRFVAPSARGSGSGLDSTNAQALATFNSVARAGDVALLLGGVYTTAPNPSASGDTLSGPIVFRSVSNNRNDVTIDADATIGTSLRRHIWIRSVTFATNRGLTLWNSARRIVVANSGFSGTGTVWLYGACDSRVDTCWSVSNGGTAPCWSTGSPNAGFAERDTMRQISIRALASTLTGSTGIFSPDRARNCLFDGIHGEIENAGTSGKQTLARIWNNNNNVFRNCFFQATCNTSSGDEPSTFWVRDSVFNDWFLRDTVIIKRGSGNVGSILLSSPGTNLTPVWSNRYTRCWFQNECNGGYVGAAQWNSYVDGDSVSYCVFLANDASPVRGFFPMRNDSDYAAPGARTAYFHHNTVVSLGTGGRTEFSTISNGDTMLVSGGQLSVRYNIFYAPALAGTSPSSAVVWSMRKKYNYPRQTAGLYNLLDTWDYNLYWLAAASPTTLVAWRDEGPGPPGISPTDYRSAAVGAGTAWYSSDNEAKDGNSRRASPRFTDSTFAAFNPRLRTDSNALFGPDGYIGAFGASTGSDVVAPGTVGNLTVPAVTDRSATLSWTAPGDDGASGTASVYDIRWSTQPITDATFGSANIATGVPAPAVAGTPQSLVIASLSPSTTYYFALKAADEVGNWSGLSNVATAATPADTVPPAAIKDLQSK